MKIWEEKLYDDNEKVSYTVYLQENSKEKDEAIDSEKKYPMMTKLSPAAAGSCESDEDSA